MNKMILFCFLLLIPSTAARAEISPAYAERIVEAIYLAEGGAKTRYPFGIMSVKCDGYEECRRICLNTVRNNWKRWEKAGSPGEYIHFLADRYCPPSADPVGNKNWKANVSYLVKKSGAV